MKKNFLFIFLISTLLLGGCSKEISNTINNEVIEETKIETNINSVSIDKEALQNIDILSNSIIESTEENTKMHFDDFNYTIYANDESFNFETPFEIGKLYVKIIGIDNTDIIYMIIDEYGEIFYFQDNWENFEVFLKNNNLESLDNPLDYDGLIYWNNSYFPEEYNLVAYEKLKIENEVEHENIQDTQVSEEIEVESIEEEKIQEPKVEIKNYNKQISKNTYFSEELFSDGSKLIIHSNIDCKLYNDSIISILESNKYNNEFSYLSNSNINFDHCDKCVK